MRTSGWRTAALLVTVLVCADEVAAQGGTDVVVPLEAENGVLVVPVTAEDGSEYRFMLSTEQGVAIYSESGKAKAGEARLGLGEVELETEGAATLPDENLTVGDVVYDGIVGANTLNQFELLIDAPNGRLVLRRPGRPMPWGGVELGPPSRLRVFHGIVLGLDVEVGGQEFPAMLALGARNVVLNSGAWEKAGVGEGSTGPLTVGAATFADTPLTMNDDIAAVRRFDPNNQGFVLVGAPLALDCAVAISYVRAEIRTCVR